jgi:predicted  nucleic acid-binding Zn-ribbon protein
MEETLGRDQLLKKKAPAELRAINKELTDIRKRITELETRKAAFERALKT